MWHDNDVSTHLDGAKQFNHPDGGTLSLDYSAFAVHGQSGLTMIVFTPASPQDAEHIAAMIDASPRPALDGAVAPASGAARISGRPV